MKVRERQGHAGALSPGGPHPPTRVQSQSGVVETGAVMRVPAEGTTSGTLVNAGWHLTGVGPVSTDDVLLHATLTAASVIAMRSGQGRYTRPGVAHVTPRVSNKRLPHNPDTGLGALQISLSVTSTFYTLPLHSGALVGQGTAGVASPFSPGNVGRRRARGERAIDAVSRPGYSMMFASVLPALNPMG